MDASPEIESSLFVELWISLASLLRSYSAAHGLHQNRHAAIAAGEEVITARLGEKWLRIEREGATVIWTRENRSSGKMEFTETGKLRDGINEEEMDLAAEAWARELMQ